MGESGESYNINADTAAGDVAAALQAERLLFLTDVEGILDRDKKLLPSLDRQAVERLQDEAVIDGGMLPKVEACLACPGRRRRQDPRHRRPGAARGASGAVHGPRRGHGDRPIAAVKEDIVKRDLLSLADITPAEIDDLLALAIDLKARRKRGESTPLLAGKALAVYLEKPSLRTRASFEVGAVQLGGAVTTLRREEVGLGTRESAADVGKVLSRYYDVVVMRTFEHADVAEVARHASVPVINGLTDLLHPCQILAALLTLREHFGSLSGLHVAYVGDGNNVANSWLLGAAQMGLRLTLACPSGYEPNAAVREQAEGLARGTGAVLEVVEDPQQGVAGADAVYTDVWASMGQEAEAARRAEVFRPYQVGAQLMAKAAPHAVAMHCLPAHRGEEITAEVLEGPRSLVFEEAENRLHAQKALLAFLVNPEGRHV